MLIDTPLASSDPASGVGRLVAYSGYRRLVAAVSRVDRFVQAHQEHLFRATAPPYITPRTFFSGVGAAIGGGRWNPPGIHTVYLASTPELATAEYLAANRGLGIADHESLPAMMEAADVIVSRCLDLRRPEVIAALKVSVHLLVKENYQAAAVLGQEARCQAFGRAIHAAGINAIIVPSRVNPKCHNVAVFRTLLASGDRCEALHPGKLPADI